MKKVFLLFLLLVVSGNLIAQVHLKGKVLSEGGTEPIIGATVLIEGTSNGTVTSVDGGFTLTAAKGDVLDVSYLGYEPQKITVSESKNGMIIYLKEDALLVDEVVVVGYQTKSKKNVTGSVATISKEVLEDRPTARGTDLLAGTAPGLIVNRANSSRIGGGDVGIQIQSVTARTGADVLVVIDGIPQPYGSAESINSINPNDIESISVLKDGEAVVYGSRASGGVIVITTKKGTKNNVQASYNVSVNTPTITPDYVNILDQYSLTQKAWEMSGINPILNYSTVFDYIKQNNITYDDIKDNKHKYVFKGGAFPDTPITVFSDYNWFDIMYGTAVTHNYDLSASGSSDKGSYYTSVGYIEEDGMLKYGNSSNSTLFARLKLDYKFTNWLSVGVNINNRYQKLTYPIDIAGLEASIAGRPSWDPAYTPEGRYSCWGGPTNPIANALERGEADTKRYSMSTQFNVDINPIKNLTVRLSGQNNFDTSKSRGVLNWFDNYRYDEAYAFPSIASRDLGTWSSYNNSFNQSLNLTASANYSKLFNNVHSLRVFGAFTHEEFVNDMFNSSANQLAYADLATVNFGNPEKNYIHDSQTATSLRGLLANVGYTFRNTYSIEGYFRRDGSSKFAPGKKWSNFFGVGGAYTISEENYFKNLNIDKFVDYLKVRVNYGELGNQNGIGIYDFVQSVALGTSNLLFGNPASMTKQQIAYMSGFASDTRTWEVTKKLNIGVDLNMFNNRLNVVFNRYKTKTDNAFYTQEFPNLLGTGAPSINGADIESKGWDLGITWRDKLPNGISYSVGGGLSDSKTLAVNLPDDDIPNIYENGWVEGYPLNAQFGLKYDGIMQSQSEVDAYYESLPNGGIVQNLAPGDVRYKDLDGDGVLEGGTLYEEDENGNPTASSGDMVYLGDKSQHYIYYLNLGVGYKGIELSAIFNGVGKWNIIRNERAGMGLPWMSLTQDVVDDPGWTPENPDANFPRLYVTDASWNNGVNGNNYYNSDAPHTWINVPWLAVKNVQLSYTFPNHLVKKIGLQNVKVFANGSNLGYIVNKMPNGYSPEQPFAAAIAPYCATYSFGINLNF